jgi:hypothetical protein
VSFFATRIFRLQPLCDPKFVTVIYERRHDTVLAELQAEFTVLKTFVFTPTRNSTPSTQTEPEMFSNRAALFQRRLYPLFPFNARGFSFGIFAPVGAYSDQGGEY